MIRLMWYEIIFYQMKFYPNATAMTSYRVKQNTLLGNKQCYTLGFILHIVPTEYFEIESFYTKDFINEISL